MNYISYKNDIWEKCIQMFKDGLELGVNFSTSGEREKFHRIEPCRTELAVNSRYLHRGYYCPSPVFDLVLTNSRRGRILRKPTKKSNITHRYLFNAQDENYITEYYLDGINVACEYIVSYGEKKYGFVFNNAGSLGGISIETYCSGKIQSYLWIKCHSYDFNGSGWYADYVRYETYMYKNSKISEFDLHFVALIEEEYDRAFGASELVEHKKYRPVYMDEQIIDLECTD